MNLISTNPNASYDLVHGKPSAIQRDNDGTYIYRFSIEPQYGKTEEDAELSQVGWTCREIRLFNQISYENLVKAVIADVFPIDYEIELMRNYNAFVLKYSEDANDKLRYLQYMKRVSELKEMVKQDLQAYGIAVPNIEKEVMPYPDIADINNNATIEAGETLLKNGKTYRAKLTHWKYQVTESNFSTFYEEL